MAKKGKKTNSKNLYDDWVGTQQKFFDNWMGATKDIQKKFVDKGAAKKGEKVINDWADTQSEMFKKWMETSEEMMKNKFTENGMESVTGFYDNWLKSQKDMMSGWQNMAGDWSKPFSGFGQIPNFGGGDYSNIFKMYGSWMDQYNTWYNTVGKPFEGMLNKMPGGLGKNTFTNIFNSSDIYMNLYELWNKNQNLFKDGITDPEAFKNLFDPEKYKEIMDKVFNFSSPEILKDFYEKATKAAGKYSPMMEETMKHFGDSFSMDTNLFPGLLTGDPKAYDEMHTKMQDVYHQFLNPLMGMTMMGKDPKVTELVNDLMKRYKDYLEQYTSFQYMTYKTGQKAAEKFVDETVKNAKKGATIETFDEFFKAWVETNEGLFTDLFRSEEFSKLQGNLVDSGLDIKKDFQDIMESMLKDYPVARRSEMNDMYKTIQELKKKVSTLEAELKQKKTPAAAKPKAKKPVARKPRTKRTSTKAK